MSLPHILLGMLHHPASGYELKQKFSQSLRHFWYADLAQIYPALHRLEQKGQVVSRQAPSDKGPKRRVYRRTESGTGELQSWLGGGPITGRERFPYLAQIMFLDDAKDAAEQIEYFESLTTYFQERVQALKAIDADWRGTADPAQFCDGELFPWFTLDLGISRNEATLRWCHRCLDILTGPRP